MHKKRLGYAEAAAHLGVSERTLRSARSAGTLQAYKVGRHAEFEVAELDRWMESNKDHLSRRDRVKR